MPPTLGDRLVHILTAIEPLKRFVERIIRNGH
jgi:hypothetical protein